MKSQEIIVETIADLPRAADTILQIAGVNKVFALYGEMGVGKTTLVKEICRKLGSADNLSSPSYSIVNEYLIPATLHKIYHIDLYRLKDLQEALHAGIEEYIYSGDYCFIEWPELIERVLPDETVKISVTVSDNTRNVSIFIA